MWVVEVVKPPKGQQVLFACSSANEALKVAKELILKGLKVVGWSLISGDKL